MLRIFIVLISLLLSWGAQARDAHAAPGPAVQTDSGEQEQAQRQRKRDGLREVIKQAPEAAPGETRKLSADERAVLRHQLRQQALEWSK